MLLGIGGKKGSGKDTSVNCLNFKNYKKIAFADSLKEICSKVYCIDIKYFNDVGLKNKPFDTIIITSEDHIINFIYEVSEIVKLGPCILLSIHDNMINKEFIDPRSILQYIGTEIIRNLISDTFLIDIMANKIQKIKNKYQNKSIIVTDMRFKNERQLIKNLGGLTVLITRPNQDQDQDQENQNNLDKDVHSSENSLGSVSEYNYTIENSGTIEELQQKLFNVIHNSQ